MSSALQGDRRLTAVYEHASAARHRILSDEAAEASDPYKPRENRCVYSRTCGYRDSNSGVIGIV
jgi:hypothetical protein